MRRCVFLAALLTGCTPLPESYPVPEQRGSKDGPEPEPLGAFVSFSDARSPDYVVGGFVPAAPDPIQEKRRTLTNRPSSMRSRAA